MTKTAASPLPFMKMHGLGNDFVVIDARAAGAAAALTPEQVRRIADRHRGVGFDQLAVIDMGRDAPISLSFWNSDGSRSSTCGNATRCIAGWEMDRTGADTLGIETDGRVLATRRADDGFVAVNMGQPEVHWEKIPLRDKMDTLSLPIGGNPTATSMGNPHCSFFVDDVDAVDLEALGEEHEHHPLFPERTNVQVVQVLSRTHLRMRVWERGVGITLASGSSSCAVAVAAARRGLTERSVTVSLDGGDLGINWAEDGVWMSGRTAHVFDGVFTPDFLAGA